MQNHRRWDLSTYRSPARPDFGWLPVFDGCRFTGAAPPENTPPRAFVLEPRTPGPLRLDPFKPGADVLLPSTPGSKELCLARRVRLLLGVRSLIRMHLKTDLEQILDEHAKKRRPRPTQWPDRGVGRLV